MDFLSARALAFTVAGILLIGAALRDIVHTLFKPSGGGSLNQAVTRLLWRVLRHRGPTRSAGPYLLLAVIGLWAVMLGVGWALLYHPHIPERFLVAPGLDPPADGSFTMSLYVSLVTLATLGFGDFVPTNGALRILVPLEALVGFGLLTAGISWILSVYPVLSRRFALATEVANLSRAERQTGSRFGGLDATYTAAALVRFGEMVVQVRNDFAQFPITYYFEATDPNTALPRALRSLRNWAGLADDAEVAEETRFSAAALRNALDELTVILRDHVPGAPEGVDAVLDAYARDHRLAG